MTLVKTGQSGNKKVFGILIGGLSGFLILIAASLSPAWQVLVLGSALTAAMVSFLLYRKTNPTFLLLCFYVFLLPVEINKSIVLRDFGDGIYLVKNISLPDIFGFLMIGSFFFERAFVRRGRKINGSDLIVPYTAFSFWSVLSVVNAAVPVYPISYINTFIKWFLTFVVIVNILDSKDRIRTVLWVFTASVLFQSLYVFLQTILHAELTIQGQKAAVMGRYLSLGSARKEYLRGSGTTEHPNVLASFMVMALPPLAALCLSPARLKAKLPFILGFICGTVSLILTFSRGGWLGFGSALALIAAVALWKRWMSMKVVWAFAVIFIVIAAAIFPVAKPVIWRLTKSDDRAIDARIQMSEQAFMMARAHPFFGVGLGNYYAVSKNYVAEGKMNFWEFAQTMEGKGGSIHNRYLGILAETGWMALFLFVWLLWRIGKRACLNLKVSDPELRFLSLGLLAAFAGISVAMTTDHYMDNTRNITFWFITALISAIPHCAEPL